jgi:hypothetical protein
MAPPRLAGKNWPRIRHDYEQTEKPIHDICAKHRISPMTLRNRVRQWGWTERRPRVPAEGPPLPEAEAPLLAAPPAAPVEARQIAQSLQNAIARVLTAIDAALAGLSAASSPRDIERAGRAVAALTRTLHELNALKAQSPAFDAENDRGPEDDNEFVQELVDRMNRFAAIRAPRPCGAATDGNGCELRESTVCEEDGGDVASSA